MFFTWTCHVLYNFICGFLVGLDLDLCYFFMFDLCCDAFYL